MSLVPISIVINTYNAAEQIIPTLESVRDFDEIVVCDMESTDDTLEIARLYGCKIVTFRKGDYNICEPARDFAIHSAKNDWVLVVDSDEIVPKLLKVTLQKILQNSNHEDAYFIPRKNLFLGEFVKASFPDYQLRFMNQTKATWPSTIHSLPQIDGKIGFLPKDIGIALEHSGLTISSEIRKLDVYSQNELVKRKKTNVNLFELILSPAYRFLRYYIFKGACFQGRRGFIKACFSSHMKFYYLAKVYEQQITKK